GWAVLVFVIAQAIAATVVLTWYSGSATASSSPMYDGTLVALVTLVTNPALVALFWGVVRYHDLDARQFLGLTRFSLRHFLTGIRALAALAPPLYLAAARAKPDWVPRSKPDPFPPARRDGWLVPLLMAVVVVGPIGEEIMFRGFLYRGWVRPGFVVTPVIMLTLLWSAMHMQYDWFGISQVFLTGLVLAWLRSLPPPNPPTLLLPIPLN